MKTRTTVTLDPDLFDRVREEAAQSRKRFGEVLNARLRHGYAVKGKPSGKRFTVEPFPTTGFAPGVDEQKLNQLFDGLESESRSA